jgi:hypothetical protein
MGETGADIRRSAGYFFAWGAFATSTRRPTSFLSALFGTAESSLASTYLASFRLAPSRPMGTPTHTQPGCNGLAEARFRVHLESNGCRPAQRQGLL